MISRWVLICFCDAKLKKKGLLMIVWLYRVGRNLNRAYRTCEFFGIKTLCLVECNTTMKGNLFKASGNVNVITANELPVEDAIYMETDGIIALEDADFSGCSNLVIGGESIKALPKNDSLRVKIPCSGDVSGLTVEGALAVSLYQWRLS